MHDTILTAMAAANTARKEYHARCFEVWCELKVIEPELTEEILALGFDEHAAAQ